MCETLKVSVFVCVYVRVLKVPITSNISSGSARVKKTKIPPSLSPT